MVGNHAESDALAQLFAVLLRGVLRVDVGVGSAGNFLNALENRAENICAVVGDAGVEVREALGALHHGAGALKAHAGVHMAGGQVAEGAVTLCIVLDEHEIPDFDALRAVLIHQAALSLAFGGEVYVQLGAGAAGTGLAHHPEIVLHAAVDDVYLRIQPLGFEERCPGVPGFPVKFAGVTLGLIRAVDGGVQALCGESPALHHQLPGPGDGFFLEVVTERPVAEHLKHGVVVGILPHILQVIVFAAGADALLRVRGTGGFPRRGPDTQEVRHKLVHAGIGEEQAGTLRHQRCGGYNGVLLLTEKIKETLANLRCGHHNVLRNGK